MIRAAINRWRDRKLHRAARFLNECRIRREREAIRAKARQLCTEMNKEVPTILRG